MFTTGLILAYLDRVFVGLHSLLRVRRNYYACGGVITRADIDMTYGYVKRLY